MGKKTEFLYLSERDTIEAGVLDAKKCIDNAEEVFTLLSEGDYLMGGSNHNSHGLGLVFPKESPFPNMPVAGPDRRFVAMPAYLGGRFDVCGNKWYGSNAENPKKGLPRSVLTVTLNDKDTGEPLAFMSANLLSAARTGAVPGVAARHLARKDSEIVAVLGCGQINRSCLRSIFAQGAGIGKLDGNPVHEDMLEAANLFRIDFSVNCILNNQLKLAAVFAGKLRESHEAAVRNVRERLGVRIQRPDILVTTPGKPLDIDFYQSVKALIALTEVLDERTVVILYCGCPEGVNSPDMLNGFKSSENLEEAVAYTINHYEVQSDHVILLAKILRKKVKVIVCCPSISDEEIREMFMEPCPTLEAALKRAEELCKKERGQILFYPKPQTGLPVLR